MKKRKALQILLLGAFLLLPFPGLPQVRKSPQGSAAGRARPPFLQQAKSFEEAASVTRLVLRNGLTILVDEYRRQPVVSIQARIQAGSFYEPGQSAGVSRLLASIIENAPTDRNRGSLKQGVRAIGGTCDWSVDYEETRFEIIAPSSQWKRALELQADAILKASWDAAALAAAAERVSGRIRDTLDNPGEFAGGALLELAFDQPRMAKDGEAVPGKLRELKQESVADFYKTMYTLPRMTLIVSGDVSASDVMNEIVRLYVKPSSAPQKSNVLPVRDAQSAFRYRMVRGEVALPHVLFGFHAVPESAADFRALEVLSAVLGLGEGSILDWRLKNQTGAVLSQKTSLLADRDFGYLAVDMEVDPQNIDRSEIAFLTEIELLKRAELDRADLARAQAQLELEYWRRRETVTRRADELGCYEALGNWKRPGSYLSEVRAVEPSDIKRVANKYLRMERCSVLEYLPASGLSRNTTPDGVKQTLEGLLQSSADQEQAKREKEVAPYIKIPTAADRFSFSEVQYPFQMASILRGPDMYVREDHTSPLIEMGLFFRGGRLAEKSENSGITQLLTRLMIMGPKEMPAAQFIRQIETYGGRLQPVVADDYFGVLFSIPSRNFPEGFELLQQAIKTPSFEEDRINRIKEIEKSRILVRKSSRAFAQDILNQALFRGFSYSAGKLGSESALSAMNAASIAEWHGEYVKNRKPYVVMIGDMKGTSLAAHFVKHFSGSRMQETKLPEEWAKAVERPEAIEQNWEREESLILVGFQAAPVDDEDGSAIRVLEELIGHQNESMEPGSHGRSPAVEASVTYAPRLRGGSLTVAAEADPGKEQEALESLKKEIREATAEPVVYRDLRAAINSAVGRHQIMSQSRAYQIQQITLSLVAGRGIDGFLNLPGDLQRIKAEDIEEVAPRILDLKKAVIVRMHGRSK